jgi:hypothetical protein
MREIFAVNMATARDRYTCPPDRILLYTPGARSACIVVKNLVFMQKSKMHVGNWIVFLLIASIVYTGAGIFLIIAAKL